MMHPEIFAIPVLMLADYYLTILGARMRIASSYSERFSSADYELNPRFQSDVAKLRWFSPKHIASLVATTLLLCCLDLLHEESGQPRQSDIVLPFVLGFLACTYLIVIGRHIGNILVFWTLRRNPGFACGRVELDHRYVLRTSAFHSAGLVLPLLALAALEPSPLTFGFALAPLRTAVFMYQWEAKYNKRLAKAAAAKPEAPEPQPASSVPARPTTNN